MAKKIRLVATDMDGTFLNEAGAFNHKRLARLLKQFEDNNIILAAASGRALLALDKLFAGFTDKIAIIAENGAFIQYKGETLFEQHMPKEQYLQLIDKILENPYNRGKELLLSGKKAAYILKDSPQSYIDHMRLYYENVQVVEDFENLEDTIFKITTNFAPQDVRNGENWLNEQLPHMQAVTTGFASIDVIQRGSNKGFGLDHLCQKLVIPSHQTLAFGDNLNDWEMLRFAGHAVAPENARSEIQKIADEVIGHHNEESVMSYMEGLVNG
ncbi:Cof-type HAD-IIB family hydrolase [Streptococcus macacae]|uniref:Cof-like hydrolase n=1 Tax=Streptococcus macacae NCTC 11558 TaxID=764298 RepID=G5JYL2_9STRE|nr:Cof-type HAD-IIB family hydrolase [Streptococcus macacae]EHJ51965.1 Cof-like hydrolase [Streptococcus macacae NCTC 11558]SUN78125.1 hydrolase [Streptococcus macacae NCTC 11558]